MSEANTDPFKVIDRRFAAVAGSARQLTIDGAAIGYDLPDRQIPVGELRSLLVHPSMSFDARDAVMSALVRNAQRLGGEWNTVLMALLIPGLQNRLGIASAGDRALQDDAKATMLASIAVDVCSIDSETGRIAVRLIWRAVRAARKEAKRLHRLQREAAFESSSVVASHSEIALIAAVAEGVIDASDAELIARTRIQRESLRAIASSTHLPYATLRRRRYRSERRLVTWLRIRQSCDVSPNVLLEAVDE